MVGGVDAMVVLLAANDHNQAYLGALLAIIGSVIGSLGLFFVARKGGEEYLHKYTSHGRGARLRAWFLEFGLLTVFVPAFVPVIPLPVKIFILTAGALEVRPLTFTLVLLAARIPRYFFLAWAGTRLGADTFPYLKQHIWQFILFAVAIFATLYLTIRILHTHRVSKQLTDSK